MTANPRPRPPVLPLTGPALTCCGASVVVDCSGTYRCPCGKDREERARKTLDAARSADIRESLRRPEDDLRGRRGGEETR